MLKILQKKKKKIIVATLPDGESQPISTSHEQKLKNLSSIFYISQTTGNNSL